MVETGKAYEIFARQASKVLELSQFHPSNIPLKIVCQKAESEAQATRLGPIAPFDCLRGIFIFPLISNPARLISFAVFSA